MITTTSRSCASLSYPTTISQDHHHPHHQDLDLQVHKLFETWPKGACREHRHKRAALLAAVEPTEGAEDDALTAAAAAGRGGIVSSVPMSDVCPYPLRGNLSSNGGGGSSNNNNNNTSRSPSSSEEVHHWEQQSAGHSSIVCPAVQQQQSPSPNMDGYSLDFERIASTVSKLDLCGWYYGQMSWQQATHLLKSKPVGTFLLRDSLDPLFLFALTVQTERGPTSVRIHYADGQFKLDAENNLFGTMPLFDCVVKLVDYYVQLSQSDKSKAHVWLDESGRRDLPVRLSRPLYCRVPQLQHLSRLAINESLPLQRLHEMNVPKALLAYIREYPYQR